MDYIQKLLHFCYLTSWLVWVIGGGCGGLYGLYCTLFCGDDEICATCTTITGLMSIMIITLQHSSSSPCLGARKHGEMK